MIARNAASGRPDRRPPAGRGGGAAARRNAPCTNRVVALGTPLPRTSAPSSSGARAACRAGAAACWVAVLLSACVAPATTGAPIPRGLGVHATGGTVTVELDGVENPGSAPVEVCLDNVVVSPLDGPGEACGFRRMANCVVVAPNTSVDRLSFRGGAPCDLAAPRRVQVIADLRHFTPGRHARWSTFTVLAEAELR
jgi:hypothetical protein